MPGFHELTWLVWYNFEVVFNFKIFFFIFNDEFLKAALVVLVTSIIELHFAHSKRGCLNYTGDK